MRCEFYQTVFYNEGDNFKLLKKGQKYGYKKSENGIRLPKKFTHDTFKKFEYMYKEILLLNPTTLLIDFSKTKQIDSAALGMLLMLKHQAENCSIKFINVNIEIQKILKVANFHKLFEIID